MFVCLCMSIHVCVFECACVYMPLCMYVCACVCVRGFVCVCVCVLANRKWHIWKLPIHIFSCLEYSKSKPRISWRPHRPFLLHQEMLSSQSQPEKFHISKAWHSKWVARQWHPSECSYGDRIHGSSLFGNLSSGSREELTVLSPWLNFSYSWERSRLPPYSRHLLLQLGDWSGAVATHGRLCSVVVTLHKHSLWHWIDYLYKYTTHVGSPCLPSTCHIPIFIHDGGARNI